MTKQAKEISQIGDVSLVIEKNIPFIARGISVVNWDEFEVGDSAYITPEYANKMGVTIASIVRDARYYGKRNNKRFSHRNRKENGTKGVRIWRIS